MGEQTVRLFRLLRPPLVEVAKTLGVGYDTVRGWSSGRADPTPQNREALASFVRQHAEELRRFADELDATR